MASVYHLYDCGVNIDKEVIEKYTEYFELDKARYFSAVKIQRVFRAYLVRKLIKKWNRAAKSIQKVVRGWLVRWKLPQTLKEHFDKKTLKYYNDQATKIQKIWKGYQVRKVIDIKRILEERRRIEEVNKRMQEMLLETIRKMKEQLSSEDAICKRVANMLFDKHHLLRTHQQEGVLSLHGTTELSEIETLLKKFGYKDYIRKIRKMYKNCSQEEHKTLFTMKKLNMMEELYRNRRDDYKEKKVEENDLPGKTFILDSRIPKEKFIPREYPVGRQSDSIIMRKGDPSKNISKTNFDLNVHKKCDKVQKPIYNPNFLKAKCNEHGYY